MEFQVNPNNVILSKIDQIESGEYNITECNFVFSNEYDGLTKIAVFTGENRDTYKITILNNKCEIPSELLTTSQIVQIGVYAYEVQGTEFVLRYSPMPTRFMIEKGSYVVNAVNMSRPTPTEVEQLQSQITHNSNNIEDLQQNVSENTTAIENLQNDVGDIQTEQTEQNTKIQKNTDDIVAINQSIGAINADIGEINQDINNLVNNKADKSELSVYSLITETGSQIELNINTTNYKMKSILKDKNGNIIFTSNEIDLPLESFVVSATYDNTTKEIVLTLQNGQTIRFSVADLVSGLVSKDDLQTILANYYTETQIDNLLNNKVDKVQGKGLSEVDFTTAKDEKLEGIEAEANKTIVDNELNNTSENPVQNKVIYEALAEKQAEINNLQTDVEDLRNASLKVTGTGTDITLNNTAGARLLDIELRGKTSQVQLEGKNLFDNSVINNHWVLLNGMVIDESNASIVKKTCNSGDNFTISATFNSINNNNIIMIAFYDSNNNLLARKAESNQKELVVTATAPDNTAYMYAGHYNIVPVQIQLEEGGEATSYEPYCGGIPSPSPAFPQPIKNVTGNANVKIQNKNLFVAQKIVDDSNNVDVYLTQDGFIRFKTGGNQLTIKPSDIKENTQYTFKLICKSGVETTNNINLIAYYTDGTNERLSSNARTNNQEFVTIFTTNENKTLDFVRSGYTDGKEAFIKIEGSMILEGAYTAETIPDYVPHAEQNYPFTFAEGQFLADDEELQDRGMYKKYAQVDLSTLNWITVGTNKYRTTDLEDIIKIPISTTRKPNIYAEKYYAVTSATSLNISGQLAILGSGEVYIYDTTGTPSGILQYELAEPTTIPYSTTQQAQFEAIKNARSYADKTIISSTSDEEGFDMYVEAIGDANKVMQSELQEIKSAVIALGGDLNV